MTDNVAEPTNPNPAHRVCPPERVGSFDNLIRPLIHNPRKLFGPHVREGMTVLDIGCGAGWATEGLAELVGAEGRVIAADQQAEMLAMVEQRLERKGLLDRVSLHRCEPARVGVSEEIGFAVAFWMAHETPDIGSFFRELHRWLSVGGRLLLAEPIGHVTKADFKREVEMAEAPGFHVVDRPGVFLSRAVVLEKRDAEGSVGPD